MKHSIPAACLFLLGASAVTSFAEVEAVQIRIQASSGDTIYEVPPGKVLIVEHICFVDYWDHQNEPKRIFLRHGGAGAAGLAWSTTQTYTSSWNQLLRPLRLPAGTGLSCPVLGDGAFQICIYGRLADEGDLFAAVGGRIKDIEMSEQGTDRILQARVELDSPRPSHVQVEKSGDLVTWTDAPGAEATRTAPGELEITLPVAESEDKQFARVVARALPEEADEPRPLRILFPF